MSASPAHAAAGHADHAHHDDGSKFQIYVQIAMLLAVITGVEIVAVYLPFAKWILVTSLVVLSVVKFMFGLVLASGTMWALLALFGAEASMPPPVG